jgi:pantoate kinase
MKPATPKELDEIRKLLAERYPNEPCFNHGEEVKKVKGLGDVVAKITGFFGIKPCSGCKKRQRALNKLVPFGE